jgi:DNA-binding protein H-NS
MRPLLFFINLFYLQRVLQRKSGRTKMTDISKNPESSSENKFIFTVGSVTEAFSNLSLEEIKECIKIAESVSAKKSIYEQLSEVKDSISKGIITAEEVTKFLDISLRKPRKSSKTDKGDKSEKPRVQAKYIDPSNSSNTWTGRGKQPNWLTAYVNQGREKEEFLIDKTPSEKAPA